MFTESTIQQIEGALGKRHPQTDALLYQRVEFICVEIVKLRSRKNNALAARVRDLEAALRNLRNDMAAERVHGFGGASGENVEAYNRHIKQADDLLQGGAS